MQDELGLIRYVLNWSVIIKTDSIDKDDAGSQMLDAAVRQLHSEDGRLRRFENPQAHDIGCRQQEIQRVSSMLHLR